MTLMTHSVIVLENDSFETALIYWLYVGNFSCHPSWAERTQ
jgi:hypothetical protein